MRENVNKKFLRIVLKQGWIADMRSQGSGRKYKETVNESRDPETGGGGGARKSHVNFCVDIGVTHPILGQEMKVKVSKKENDL